MATGTGQFFVSQERLDALCGNLVVVRDRLASRFTKVGWGHLHVRITFPHLGKNWTHCYEILLAVRAPLAERFTQVRGKVDMQMRTSLPLLGISIRVRSFFYVVH